MGPIEYNKCERLAIEYAERETEFRKKLIVAWDAYMVAFTTEDEIRSLLPLITSAAALGVVLTNKHEKQKEECTNESHN